MHFESEKCRKNSMKFQSSASYENVIFKNFQNFSSRLKKVGVQVVKKIKRVREKIKSEGIRSLGKPDSM